MTDKEKLQLLQELEKFERLENEMPVFIFREIEGSPGVFRCRNEEHQHLFPDTFQEDEIDPILNRAANRQHFPAIGTNKIQCMMMKIITNRRKEDRETVTQL